LGDGADLGGFGYAVFFLQHFSDGGIELYQMLQEVSVGDIATNDGMNTHCGSIQNNAKQLNA